MKKLFLIILLGIILSAGCTPSADPSPTAGLTDETASPAGQGPETEGPPTRVLESATATPEPTPQEAMTRPVKRTPSPDSAEQAESPGKASVDLAGAVIMYHRSGGLAGLDEQWAIYADGRVEGPGGQTAQVSQSQVQALLAAIDKAGFFGLKDSYAPLDACCDRFTYVISVQQGNAVKSVVTVDAAPDQPEALTEVMESISQFLDSTR